MRNNMITRLIEVYVLEMAVILKMRIKKNQIWKFKQFLLGKKNLSKNQKFTMKVESFMYVRKMKRQDRKLLCIKIQLEIQNASNL